jgi:hypothetical protein
MRHLLRVDAVEGMISQRFAKTTPPAAKGPAIG